MSDRELSLALVAQGLRALRPHAQALRVDEVPPLPLDKRPAPMHELRMHDDQPADASLRSEGYELIETHISRVYLAGDHVYKFKRAVNLGFLDFTTREARRAACVAEVALNRRLAPAVYVGVAALTRGAGGRLALVPPEGVPDAEVLDWAVHMRRLADAQRADIRLAAGALDVVEIDDIARLLAGFHANARSDAAVAQLGSPERVGFNVEENFTQIAGSAPRFISGAELQDLQDYQRGFLRDRAALLRQRAERGYVRDGHGDLRLEHIYRDAGGGHAIIDCIEFNDRFRYADVCADLAFLSMDLRAHERPDLAELLLAGYARESGDYGLYALTDFYESYRAVVRAKVASLLADDPQVAPSTRERAEASARRYYLLAISAARPALSPPRLVVCMGKMASGKSTLARALGQALAAPVLSADLTRKQLLGVEAVTPLHHAAFTGAYTAEQSGRVYASLRERCALALAAGRSVILDATFSTRAERQRATELAAHQAVPITFLMCECDRATSLERLERRAQAASVSDGRAEIYDQVAQQFEPIHASDAGELFTLNSSAPLADTLRQALAKLGG
ncbi:MAG TPA: AAA family ATPase [Polyangiales bacterium]